MSTRGDKTKRALGVQQALEWAFRVEKARLELPPPDAEEGFGFGLEYVLMQRAALGCRIDGGQHKPASHTHEDAEVIAATLTGLPDTLGGKRMAIRIAELARAGITPDWMPGAVPRCVPVEVKRNQYAARRHYDAWWQALAWICDGLIAGGMLREIDVTDAMPKYRPWEATKPARSPARKPPQRDA